jgi:hypothetical protein
VQIDIDFEVFQKLTALLENEADCYNAVIRRQLGLPTTNALRDLIEKAGHDGEVNTLANRVQSKQRKGLIGSKRPRSALASDGGIGGLLKQYIGGVWFSNIHFPEGTEFRATYKGQTYYAEIKDGAWLGADGVTRNSPSDAAAAISHTNVNGWRFWYAQMPGDPSWRRLDELRK